MRFTKDPIYPDEQLVPILDDGCILTVKEVVGYLNWYRNDMRKVSVENENLKIENVNYLHIIVPVKILY